MIVTGVSGLLGNNLAYYFRDQFEILGLYHSHPVSVAGIFSEKCNISNPGEIATVVDDFRPDVVIHCASLTNIDECETDKGNTWNINVQATNDLVETLHNTNSYLVYISSDSVYEGKAGSNRENGNIEPVNYYGHTKYEGESFVANYKNGLVLRTNIFGWNIQNKNSLAEWILKSLQANDEINGFTDATFSTIYTMELASIIDLAIHNRLIGIYNCGSIDSCSKYEFALKIADWFGLRRSLISPMSIDSFNFKAKRGKKLSINVDKLQTALGYQLPTIDHCVERFYRDYMTGLPNRIKSHFGEISVSADHTPYGRQWIDSSDIDAVAAVLRSERITQGPRVEDFEQKLIEVCNARYAVAVNSGTSALHIACLAAGIKEGDEVITSPITFVASANCSVYCGAKPVFADIDPRTNNISPGEIEKKITERTKAVIPVHLAGQSCDMQQIKQIVRKAEKKYRRPIYIIEDASHALGSTYRGTMTGSCAFSDMTCMSFHPVKHVTTGEGGAVFTNSSKHYNKLKRFRSHGITGNIAEMVNTDEAFAAAKGSGQKIFNPWYYEQQDIGHNYRLTDIQAALGISQLRRLSHFKRIRRKIINRYNEEFGGIAHVQIPYEREDCDSNFHLYILLFDFEKIGFSRAELMTRLQNSGVLTQVHYIPVHTQPYYQKNYQTGWGDCPVAENYYRRCLSIPLFPAMREKEIDKTITEIKNRLP